MKNLLLVFALFCTVNIFSQLNMSAETKHYISSISESLKQENTAKLKALRKKLPIIKMFGKEVLACLAIINNDFNSDEITLGSTAGKIASLYIPINNLAILNTTTGIEYLQIASKIQPLIEEAVEDVRADSVQLGIGLNQAYTGKNVMIGITDWGFDYTHPNFYDTTLTNTRIHAVWDHYRSAGTSPANYNYGVEYNSSTDILSAKSDTFNVYNYAYHGTHVAGIAAGSGAGEGKELRGVAFESDLLFVTFYHNEASVLDAFNWMKEKAEQENKRLVINMSWGLYYLGNLDGTSLIGQAITNLANQNIVFVTSAGNNGSVNFHLEKTFNNDSIASKVNFYPYSAHPNMWGQSLTMWGEVGHNFKTKFEVKSGTNTVAQSIWYDTDNLNSYIDSYVVTNNDTIWYNLSMDSANYLNQRPHARLRIKNTNTSLSIIMKAKSASGKVHFWNVTELDNDLGNWGMPFSTFGTGTIAGNTHYAIGEPACNQDVISVGSYLANYSPNGTSVFGGQMSNFSSEGPTLDDRVKPEITAPGQGVVSSLSSYATANPTISTSVNFNGNNYPFGSLSGTSMSSPVVAGVVALLLEANPNLTPQEIKDFITVTARLDNYTGVLNGIESNEWGAGKINAYAAILGVTGLGSLEEVVKQDLSIYPNPTTGLININTSVFSGDLTLYNISGKVMGFTQYDSKIDLSHLKTGIYFLSNQQHRVKIIKL